MVGEIFSETGIIVIVVAVLILFGGTALPKFARSLGSAQAEFKKGLAGGADDKKSETADSSKAESADSTTSEAGDSKE